ncbi:hypothetical protein, partial [Saccharothrix longispora]|uniref:hypothetical protein n=1 Tax=Saccharothrix longispora TaxID=33920 RepID=UPI0028FDB9C5
SRAHVASLRPSFRIPHPYFIPAVVEAGTGTTGVIEQRHRGGMFVEPRTVRATEGQPNVFF